MTTPTPEPQEIGLGYLRTFPGVLKLCQELANFVGMVCVAAGGNTSKGDAFIACSVIALLVTGLFLVSYVTQIVVKLTIPWYRIEFFFCIAWIIFYIVVSALVVSTSYGPYVAGGVFGFIATVLYGADAYHKFRLVMAS